ncbi:MAG: hypothetical protein J6U67_08745 [Lachnospiraceae bacterium]|nr:hypothetical protein [Lachnospiraceae bacterium]
MSDSYVECLVAQKTSPVKAFFKYLLITLTVISGLAGLVFGSPILVFVAAAFGVGAYFVSLFSNVEFEYLYLDKEISVAKIYNKQRRKKVGTYELDKIEIMAPLNSWHLDSFKNRTFKEVDYSSGVAGQPEKRYLFYYNGEQKVIFEPNAELVKLARNAAPRKVFID